MKPYEKLCGEKCPIVTECPKGTDDFMMAQAVLRLVASGSVKKASIEQVTNLSASGLVAIRGCMANRADKTCSIE